MCEFITEEWNKVSPYKLTTIDVLQFDKIRRFPSVYLPILYNAAQENLRTFLYEDETCAVIFLDGVYKIHKGAIQDYDERRNIVSDNY